MRRKSDDMKKWIAILLLGICAVINCHAAVISATVESKALATVSGDETGRVQAVFSTTSNYKDRITADNRATLCLLNLPDGRIDYIAVYMHSNKTSGAGSLSLKLNEVTIASVSDKKFSDWPGQTAFTDEYVPVYFNGPWEISDGTTLELKINASANSLYFSQVDVSFTQGAVKPYTVTFNWNTSEGDKHTAVTESSIGAGIILPDCQLQSFTLDDEDWAFVGWTNDRVLARMYSAPALWYPGKSYYPVRNMNMFAVYKTVTDIAPIMQDTLYKSGMYALVMTSGVDSYYMAQGGVNEKRIAAVPCDIEMQEDGRYRLMQDYVPANSRYWVEFDEQTLTIRYLSEDKPVGHSTTDLEQNNQAWIWSDLGWNHSTAIYFAPETKDNVTKAKLLMPLFQDLDKGTAFQAKTSYILEDYEYTLLFDVIEAPATASSTIWTTHPFGYEAISLVESESGETVKKIFCDGLILIEKGGVLFDLQGRKYKE